MVNSPPELSQLRDIHLPDPISWWPLAPGWYLLLLIILIFVTILFLIVGRYYRNGRAKRQALHLLDQYLKDYQRAPDLSTSIFSTNIAELLKRVALAYYPRSQVASLQGDAWIQFLNCTAKGVDFYSVREALLELPYQPGKKYDLRPLFTVARQWIKRQRGKLCLN